MYPFPLRNRWPFVLAALLACAAPARAQDAGRVPLFDGATLEGWEGDRATFRVEDGAIVGGTLAENIPRNEFLCTTDEYGDFELRIAAKLVGPGDNAGIQFRSRRVPNHHEVSGYQADVGTVGAAVLENMSGYERPETVAPDSALSVWGALYDETRRNGYLTTPPVEKATAAEHRHDWNTLVVRAEGPRIQIWLNDVQTVDYTEQSHIPRSGVICLQIHSGAPAEAWYKDITIQELGDGDN